MVDKQLPDRDNIEPGMTVEATEGDLGEQDISKPKVTDVAKDAQGNVEKAELFPPYFRPGFIGGMSGNDSSAVTAYAVDGATAGYGHLWLMVLSTFMYQSVQYSCAKIGRITQEGLSSILRKHYGRWVALLAASLLIIANVALVEADLVAIGSGLELITGLSWFWFVVPIAVILWYLTVYRNFETIKKVFIVMSLEQV